MNKQAIYHQPDSNYCYPLEDNVISVRLRVSKEDTFNSIDVIYGDKYTYQNRQIKLPMKLKYTDELFSYYQLDIKLDDVRFVYIFQLINSDGKFYFCEDGIVEKYDFKLAYFNCFQYPYINSIDVFKRVSWMKNAIFYEIFVDRFNMGNSNKDYINMKWNDKPRQNSFAGGDLIGIIKKLDYLKHLGINVIYLTPIFSSISNHKYDIKDYYKIDAQFGDETIFQKLVDTAHKKGIRIVIDGVFNHSSNLLSQFQDVVKNGKKSKYFNWFIIHGDKIDQKKINYETFANCYYHPKFNTSNCEVQKFLIDIGKYYVEKFDIDGWRLDVSDELSHDFWRNFRREIKNIKPDCLLLGENWHDSYPFLRGDQFDSIMNYSFTKAMLDYFVFETSDAEKTANKLNSLLIRNSEIVNSMMLNLLDSHDTDRFYSAVHESIDKLLSALAIQFTFKGVPGLYYGIEIPTTGGYDPDNRKCMNWNKLNQNSPYFKKLKAIIDIRKEEAIIDGEIKITSHNELLIIERYIKSEKIILAVNNTAQKIHFYEEGEKLVSHRYSNNYLNSDSFIIEKVKK